VTTAYDLVRYPSCPIPETHPASLSVLAALYGLSFVPYRKCRVLEIGCGEGVNLMSMAVAAPESDFVGIDLAETAIALGRETAAAAGLANVTLQARDLLETGPDLGQFDYIIGHGLYSWVPEPVRAAVMALIGRSLGPDGLAYLGYKTYPGARLNNVLRDLLLEATRGLVEPREKLDAALAALRYQIDLWSEADPFQHAMILEARYTLTRPPQVLFHDLLGEVYEPQLLGAVVAAARAEGLDYLCDAGADLNAESLRPTERYAAVRSIAGGDFARFEQLTDFTETRRFRRSVFCRAGRLIDRRAVPERSRGLYASSPIELSGRDADGPDGFVLRASNGAELSTRDPALADFLVSLGRAYPASLPLDDVALNPELAEVLLHLFLSGMVTLSTAPSACASTAGERPVASPLVRAQARRGEADLATLRHTTVHMADPEARAFLTLLDGTRTHGELVCALVEQAGMTIEAATARLPEALAKMARLGFMMG